jgi:hypothetical protein
MPAEKPDKITALAKHTIDAQVQQVVTWIIDGHSRYDVVEAIENKITKNAKEKRLLMDKVLEYFTNSSQADPAVIRGWAIESLRELYRRMVETGDFAGARQVVKDICAMQKARQ